MDDITYLQLKNRLQELKDNKENSASEIFFEFLSVFNSFLDKEKKIPHNFKDDVLSILKDFQPEMAQFKQIFNILPTLPFNNPYQELNELFKKLTEQFHESEKSVQKMIDILLDKKIFNIFTLSYSSQVLKTIIGYSQKLKVLRVIISASSPKFEGIRLAKRLSNESQNLQIILIDDAQISSEIQQTDKSTSAVLIGCDSIFKDYSILNKTGSLCAAITCNYYKIPFFVIGSSIKLRTDFFRENIIQQQNSADYKWYYRVNHHQIPMNGRFFDYIPNNLITKIIF